STTLQILAGRRDSTGWQLAAWSVGDGESAALMADGSLQRLLCGEGGEFAGETRFLDPSSARRPAQVFHLPPDSQLLCMSDGVADPWFDEPGNLDQPAPWLALWQDLVAAIGPPPWPA